MKPAKPTREKSKRSNNRLHQARKRFYSWYDGIKNLVKQPVPDKKKDKTDNIIKWQADDSNANDFPQQLVQNVKNSVTASAAVDIWQEYTEGDGLMDEEAGNADVNEEQTMNELHSLLASDIATFWGFCFIQRYNPEGEPSERWHLPFEEVRLGIADEKTGKITKLYHNPYFGIKKSYDKKYTKWYYAFNDDPEFVQAQIEAHNAAHTDEKTGQITMPYPGQLYWFMIPSPLARVYPQVFYYSATNWQIVDAEIPAFHERNIKNNFLASVLVNMYGNPDDPAGPPVNSKEDPDKTEDQGITVGEEMDKQFKQMTEEKGGILFNWFTRQEEKATFEAFPTNSHHDLFMPLQTMTDSKIAIGHKTPRILLGIETTGKLGDSKDVINAVFIMQGRTRRLRNHLKRCYEKVFGLEDGTIKNINPFDIIPDEIWNSLSLQEQRTFIGEHYDIELGDEDAPSAGDDVTIEEVIENKVKTLISKHGEQQTKRAIQDWIRENSNGNINVHN